jgi:hypothetical protein
MAEQRQERVLDDILGGVRRQPAPSDIAAKAGCALVEQRQHLSLHGRWRDGVVVTGATHQRQRHDRGLKR